MINIYKFYLFLILFLFSSVSLHAVETTSDLQDSIPDISISDNLNMERANETPAKVNLKQNYPNPFNPVTIITYQVPSGSNVRLDVYHILGHRISTLVDEYVESGTHQVTFDASSLASGVYIYRLTAGDQTHVRRMTVMK